jgi:hypothetical protein
MPELRFLFFRSGNGPGFFLLRAGVKLFKMPLIHGNFPDEIWQRLKAWAKIQADGSESPSEDDCAQYVERLAQELGGSPKTLPDAVVRFYAVEVLDMIRNMRAARAEDPA